MQGSRVLPQGFAHERHARPWNTATVPLAQVHVKAPHEVPGTQLLPEPQGFLSHGLGHGTQLLLPNPIVQPGALQPQEYWPQMSLFGRHRLPTLPMLLHGSERDEHIWPHVMQVLPSGEGRYAVPSHLQVYKAKLPGVLDVTGVQMFPPLRAELQGSFAHGSAMRWQNCAFGVGCIQPGCMQMHVKSLQVPGTRAHVFRGF